MADQRLFGIGISTEFNGHGATPRSLTNAGKVFVEYGGNMGIALSWLIHEILARWFFMSFGTEAQKNNYLPQLAAGKTNRVSCGFRTQGRCSSPSILKRMLKKPPTALF